MNNTHPGSTQQQQSVQMTAEQATEHFKNQIRLIDESLVMNRKHLDSVNGARVALVDVLPVKGMMNAADAVTAIGNGLAAQVDQLTIMVAGQEADKKRAEAMVEQIAKEVARQKSGIIVPPGVGRR